MNISREHASAFLALTRKKTFSAAAELLHITQAAFSIRIQRLEEELQHTLVIRNKNGINLTEAGKKFLNYCEMIEGLENEFLEDFKEDEKILKGTIRIGTFSTIGRSVILPVISDFMRLNRNVYLNYMVKELSELTSLLVNAELDFIFLDQPLNKEGFESVYLGEEEYVLIRSAKYETNLDIYLNHDENDQMSFKYLDHVGKKNQGIKRKFLDEIYSVIDGVAEGWGVSVLPEHLIRKDDRIKILQPRYKLTSSVYLCYRSKPYYSKLFKGALDLLRKEVPKGLKQKS